jgi:hypothetical protein
MVFLKNNHTNYYLPSIHSIVVVFKSIILLALWNWKLCLSEFKKKSFFCIRTPHSTWLRFIQHYLLMSCLWVFCEKKFKILSNVVFFSERFVAVRDPFIFIHTEPFILLGNEPTTFFNEGLERKRLMNNNIDWRNY